MNQFDIEIHLRDVNHLESETQMSSVNQENDETHCSFVIQMKKTKKTKEKASSESKEFLRLAGRIVSGAYYDHQQVRIMEMHRIRDIIRKRYEGIPFDKPEEKKENKKYDKKYADRGIPELLVQMLQENKLTQEEYDYISKMMAVSKEAQSYEEKYKKLMMDYISQEPIYQQFLSKIKGIGPVLSANLIKNFGYCEKYPYVSSLWKHCGLHVVDGEAPKLRKGKTIDWNPKLRVLAWKISDSFIKARTPGYRKIYDQEKKRQLALIENKSENAPKNKLHADLRARRKMVKIFLQHYWILSRKLAGKEITMPYQFDKMGHKHYISPEDILDAHKKAELKQLEVRIKNELR